MAGEKKYTRAEMDAIFRPLLRKLDQEEEEKARAARVAELVAKTPELVAQLKAAKLEAQWPKRCGCGRLYEKPFAVIDLAERARTLGKANARVDFPWGSLPFAYPRTDAFGTIEARHCVCGSTLEVLVAIHDLNQE